MTREEAIAVFEKIKVNYEADPDWGVYDGVFSRRNLTEILDAYAALRGPQPDPDTGLVPCGCGGKAKVWPSEPTQFTRVITDYEVGCTECAMTTGWVRGKQENAVKAWNTAMGWKGGAAMQRVDVAPGFDSIRPEKRAENETTEARHDET